MPTKIEELKEVLGSADEPDAAESPDRVYLFVSYDLVEATAFKAVSKEWPVVISKFYELSIREIQELSGSFSLWKLAGDEVLMYREVNSFDGLAKDIKNLHTALNKVIGQLHNSFERTRNLLSAKGTVWLAQATFIPPQKMQDALSTALRGSEGSGGPVNIRIQFPLDATRNAVDFLGPDVDVGFRIAQFADKGKLVVSANLANIIMTYSPRTSIDVATLKIVAFRQLKGVWNGRPYPIIWYHDDWAKIAETFYYDDASPIITEVGIELDPATIPGSGERNIAGVSSAMQPGRSRSEEVAQYPSRSMRLRRSLRWRRTASACSRARRSEGFS